MSPVISGLISGLVSGIVLSGAIVALYAYEKFQARKAAANIVNNLKSMYYDKTTTVSSVKSGNKFN